MLSIVTSDENVLKKSNLKSLPTVDFHKKIMNITNIAFAKRLVKQSDEDQPIVLYESLTKLNNVNKQ